MCLVFFFVLLFLLSLFTAYLSWRFIESPFRNAAVINRLQVVQLSILSIFVFLLLGGVLIFQVGFNTRATFHEQYEVGDYKVDNHALINESWSLLEGISNSSRYRVDDNSFDQQLWFNQEDSRTRVLVVGNSHSKDVYNVLSYSEQAKRELQLARYGTQVSNINNVFFNSPNYLNAQVIIVASLNSDDDIGHFERVIKRIISDKKTLVFMTSPFIKMERKNITFLDALALKHIKRGEAVVDISKKINRKYTDDFYAGHYVHEKWKIYAENEKKQLVLLNEQYHFQTLDRMNYVCGDDLCELVSQNLGKYFYDKGHHTLRGAKYFARKVDELNWVYDYIRVR